jgi:Zn-dependent metalloprotease
MITNNVIYLNQDELVSAGGLGNQHQVMNADNETTFALIRETQGRLDKTKIYRRYQQYYKGVLVDGGGYTAALRVTTGPGDEPHDPCDGEGEFMLSPQIFSGININVTPQINDATISQIINGNVIGGKELIIQHDTYQNCGYDLFWKVNFDDTNDGAQVSWINATTGELIKTISPHKYLNAPTEDYGVGSSGTVFLDDFTLGNTTILKNADESVITYDFTGMHYLGGLSIDDYDNNLIPTTNGNQWTTTVADKLVYQAHHVTTRVVEHYDESLSINFGTVHVAGNIGTVKIGNDNVSAAVISSGMNDVHIFFSKSNSITTALIDVAAHELAHAFLDQFLDYSNLEAGSLHEGIADMFGVYIESLEQGSIDWEMGDDNDNIVRNLISPEFSCFDDVQDSESRHDRGEPLGHWFYLITEGNPSLGIPSLGINTSIQLVIDALSLIGTTSDYPQLRDATLTTIENEFGLCSDEYLAVHRAWAEICLEPNTSNCSFSVNGPYQVCEEDNYAVFCVEGGLPNTHYMWRILGPMSTGYESLCGMTGNTQNGCNCLTLTDFPDYPFYPQNVTIEIYSPSVGSNYTVRKYLRLIDCNGDDPTCEEYYSLDGLIQGNETQLIQSKTEIKIEDMNGLHSENNQLTVYNILGHLIYQGNIVNWTEQNVSQSGIYLFIYSDENGTFIRQEKRALIKDF